MRSWSAYKLEVILRETVAVVANVEGEHSPSDPACPFLQHSALTVSMPIMHPGTGEMATERMCGHTGTTIRWTLMRNYIDHLTLEACSLTG